MAERPGTGKKGLPFYSPGRGHQGAPWLQGLTGWLAWSGAWGMTDGKESRDVPAQPGTTPGLLGMS